MCYKAERYKVSHSSRGMTLLELLVSMLLFSTISAGVSTFMINSYRDHSLERQGVEATSELRHALELLTAELRTSKSSNRYLVSSELEELDCTDSIQISPDGSTLSFITMHDNPGSPQGRQAYFVAYQYDPTRELLLRGEIALATQSCLPSNRIGDPLTKALTLAEHIEQLRFEDGSREPVFVRDESLVDVNLGLSILHPGSGRQIQHAIRSSINVRGTV